MINSNQAVMGISTDYGIATILGNFSDDFIEDTIKESINYRFRPYSLRSPNYPEILNSQLLSVLDHSSGYDEQIKDKRIEVFNCIIGTINEFYNLRVIEDIPEEQTYSIAYMMYQIFVSEFTERMLNFYTQYIIDNMESLLKYLTTNSDYKPTKTAYAKKIYNSENYITIYDNMNLIVDILAGLDIPFDILVSYMADRNTANIITSFIAENDDTYKNRFANFILDPSTRPDIITAIRFKFVQATAENKDLFDPAKNMLFTTPDEGIEEE